VETKQVDRAGRQAEAEASELEKHRPNKKTKVSAELMTSPSFLSAHTAMSFVPGSIEAHGMNIVDMVQETKDAVQGVVNGDMTTPEALLMAQAMSLNAIYNQCASWAGENMGKKLPQAEVLMRMALKAQAQCAQTLRVLGELKAPKSVSFIKQQNNAHQQQVNNGTAGANGVSNAVAPARTETEVAGTSNELLTHEREAQDAATLDTGATSRAGRSDQTLEAVEAVQRTSDA